ncbi:MAG: CHASE2 domain-containing protein [Cyanobacteria bacterium P01_G01_bin.54]
MKHNSWWRNISIVAALAACTVFGMRYLGLLQDLEWAAYDQFLRWHTATLDLPTEDRIKIVTIDEADLHAGGQALISDRALAQALRTLAAQQPLVIGLDLYRDLPVPPGQAALRSALAEIPNVVGIQKVGHPQVAPPAGLPDTDRVVANDLMLDGDYRVRRGFLFVIDDQGHSYDAFAPYIALWWLEAQDIYFEKLSADQWRLGATTFKRFGAFDGGYVRAKTGGYQLLINYRGFDQQFETIPFRAIMAGHLPPDWARNRIVLIGNIAESSADRFATPLSTGASFQSPISLSGVEVQAHIIAQILDAATGDRPLLKTLSEPIEILWIGLWSTLGAIVTGLRRTPIQSAKSQGSPSPKAIHYSRLALQQIGLMMGLLSGLMVGSYFAFTQALWLPIIPPILGFITASGGVALYSTLQVSQLRLRNETLNRLANLDSLTQIANRRFFDIYLQQICLQAQQQQQPLALILCDVDYFKRYNDTYGHQMGDNCLRQIAQILSKSVQPLGGLVARYGGEEFAVILSQFELKQIEAIATTIQQNLAQQTLPHRMSEVSQFVTLSMGIAIIPPSSTATNAIQLIRDADQALYHAKQAGRNCYYTYALHQYT